MHTPASQVCCKYLLRSHPEVAEITDTDLELKIELPKLKDNAEFWRMLEEQLASVNAFYQKQEDQMAAQFQTLTIQALKLVSVWVSILQELD